MSRYPEPSPPPTTGIASTFEAQFYDDAHRTHQRRLSAYRLYWLYYLGRHWSYARDPGEPTITINYCKRIVNLHNDFCFKRGFTAQIPDDPATVENEQEDREFVRLMLEETWRRNGKILWALEAGQQGGVSGDVFARVSWERNDPLEEAYARVDILPSHLVFPEFGGPYGVDRKKLTRVLVMTPTFVTPERMPLTGAFFTRRTKSAPDTEMVIKSEIWTSPVIENGVVKLPAQVRYYTGKEPDGPAIENPLGELPPKCC